MEDVTEKRCTEEETQKQQNLEQLRTINLSVCSPTTISSHPL